VGQPIGLMELVGWEGSVAVSATLQEGVLCSDIVTGVSCGREAPGDICMGRATERKWKESVIRD
jgi:hypothetical protein